MTFLTSYLSPEFAPSAIPSLAEMNSATQTIHQGVDQRIKRTKEPYLHPDGPTVQTDLFGSTQMIQWQEQKGARSMLGEDCWSDLPQIYGRYATSYGNDVITEIKSIEKAAGVILTDCGMQATAILQDVLLRPGGHAIMSRQVYNKSKAYLNWVGQRMGVETTIVEELTAESLKAKCTPQTTLIFAETFTNPLMNALDLKSISDAIVELRKTAPEIRLVIDNTIATPWGVRDPLLSYPGIDAVVSAGTKAMGGQDRDMWGYIASNRTTLLNEAMDIQAMRGGVLAWRSALSVKESLAQAQSNFELRCANAQAVVQFLDLHPLIESVFHPMSSSYRHASVFAAQYTLGGSLLSFRVKDLDENHTMHFCDVLALTNVFRYALSFDGLVSKVNHHKSVSEYYTPPPLMKKQGIDRLVRLGLGWEASEDLIACLNWALWNHQKWSQQDVIQAQRQRISQLGLPMPPCLKTE